MCGHQGQYVEIGSLLPLCRFWGSTSGCEAWGQTTLVTEPTCPDEELLIEGYEKTVGAKLWAP